MKATHTHKEFYEGVRRYGSASVMRKEAPSLYKYGFREGLLKGIIWPNPKCGNLHTREEFNEAVRRYGSPSAMRRHNNALYSYGCRRGWNKNADYSNRRSRIYIPEKQLKKEVFNASRKFHSRGEFRANDPKNYDMARRKGWLDKMHWLKPMENPIKDRNNYVYAYVFERQKTAYVGLTYHGSERHIQHKHRGPVFDYAKENNINVPEPIILEDNLDRLKGVRKQEHYWKCHYISLGYNILNKGKTGEFSGSLGRMAKMWTRKRCRELALRCSCATEMRNKFSGAYNAACKNGWLVDYTWFVVVSGKPKPVLQYTKDGQLIGRYDSMASAAMHVTGKKNVGNIFKCVKGERKSAYGFVWKYADESIPCLSRAS